MIFGYPWWFYLILLGISVIICFALENSDDGDGGFFGSGGSSGGGFGGGSFSGGGAGGGW